MDEITKRAIKKTILALRNLLEKEDIPAVLKQHGIFPDGRRVHPEKISLLDDAGKSRRERLEAILEREIKAAGNDPKAGVERYCREVAFTFLNRLIALRCMEARGLIDECIKTRADYAGRSLRHNRFRREYPEKRFDGEDTDGLKAFLHSVFRELQDDIKILFDPDDEYSIIMPSLKTLRECIRALNEDIAEDAFKEPELIGWVYQYFQTEEKDRVFEEVRTKKKKIQGDDIVPATSLYTERYMVDYLVQNSLGAIWMEMYPDSKLCEKWPYFVKDQDLKPRESRPLRSLTFLDPACGSGHFLLVAFDLLVQMYEEEACLANEGRIPREWVVPEERIATTIIESNLHGIDIDLRSVQLSWLTLYLKMREHQNSVDAPKSLPEKVNLVATDASLLDTPEFLSWCEEKFKGEPYVLNIIKGVAKRLHNLPEIGSLARPEEDLKELIKKEKERLLSVWKREKQPGQMVLFQEFLTPEQQELPFEKVTDVQFWDRLTRRFLRMLDVFLKRTREEMRKRLFATDLQRVIVFLDLCRKRYDIVATNPPYMGSRNMGKSLRNQLKILYSHNNSDLFASFIERCISFSAQRGITSMITQQSFLFLTTFSSLRSEIIRNMFIRTIVHLGPHAFKDIQGEKVNTVLFSLDGTRAANRRSVVMRLLEFTEKGGSLKKSLSDRNMDVMYFVSQHDFKIIEGCPLVYWAIPKVFKIFRNSRRLDEQAFPKEGINTGNNDRFIRFWWEVDINQIGESKNWTTIVKGGKYSRFYGNLDNVVHFDEEAMKKYSGSAIRNKEYFFREGITFCGMSSKGFSARYLPPGCIFAGSGRCIFFQDSSERFLILGFLNSILAKYFLSLLNPTMSFTVGDIAKLPIFFSNKDSLINISKYSQLCTVIKKTLLVSVISDREFDWKVFQCSGNEVCNKNSLLGAFNQFFDYSMEKNPKLLTFEGLISEEVLTTYNIQDAEASLILDYQARPLAWFPLIEGYEILMDDELNIGNSQFNDYLQNHEVTKLSSEDFTHTKSNLRKLYEAGPGTKMEDVAEDEETETSDDEKESETLIGKRIPIPTETFLEELSVKMEIHPISIYWLLKEMREKEGVVCWPECKRYVEDYFTVMILRMLGFRWPKQIEANEPVPKWADKDGIIPITGHTGEKTLFERVRDRIGSEFGEDRIDAIETEFADILYNADCKGAEVKGKRPPRKKITLADWLEREFFKRHTSQFKKRPIAWHLTSSNGTFQVLLFYHRLLGDILKNLKNRYLARVQSYYGVLLEKARGGESVSGGLTPGKLQDIEAELEDFAAKLDKVINLPYEPLIDDGVRVNIASLQKMGLLKHPVLAAKDVDRAIADRNRWREDDKEQNTVWNLKELKT